MGRPKGKSTEILKECTKCQSKLDLGLFYLNREWAAQMYRDKWCKKCATNHIIDKNTLIEYCKNNKRMFVPELWESANLKATKTFEEDEKLNSMRDLKKKAILFLEQVKKNYFQYMNMIQNYKFSNESNEVNESDIDLDDESYSTQIGMAEIYGKKTFNKTWFGSYSVGELEYLDTYFEGLSRDFKLENSAYIDYARKVCKASLSMDKAYDALCQRRPGSEKRYKDSKDIFDQLSQSAKFAEKTRSEHDSVGFGSLGEVIKKMESTGFLQKPITFPKDDIDKIIDDFKWIITSVGEEF